MRTQLAIVLFAALGTLGACKKGPGGGGGGWLVGKSGLMANVQSDDSLGAGYQLGATENLNGIACRYQGEAWVVGDAGTLLYTNDGGSSWSVQAIPTTANLRALATQDTGPVFVGGDGVLLESTDTGASWTSIATSSHIRSIAAAQEGSTVLAVSDEGEVFGIANGQLTQLATIAGAKAIAVSPDGQTAVVAGNGLMMSTDAGHSWKSLAVNAQLEDVNIVDDLGDAVAVGDAGAIAWLSAGAVQLQHVGTANLHTVHMSEYDSGDEVTGYAAGDGGQILITHDGGARWSLGPNVGRTVFGVDMIGAGHR